MILKRIFIALFLILLGTAGTVLAEMPLKNDQIKKDQPIDISADQALEWDRKNGRYIARGNARAVQGGMTLLGDELIAAYDPAAGSSDLSVIEAIGHVQIISDQAVIFGDHGTYDLTTGRARVTGDDLRLVNDETTITADDYFEYDQTAEKIHAVGNAAILRGEDKMTTAKLVADLTETVAGETVIQTVTAPGHVTILTENEKITGDRGTYDAVNEIATLYGNVKITQDENVLNGNKATVDMKTGLSRLFAPESEDGLPGRVRGTFYPKAKTEQKDQE